MNNVSIVMSVYNEKIAFLEKAIDSIIEQTHTNWELIIIDDGSTQAETRETLGAYSKKDSRILVYYEKHCGLVKSLNKGISLASSEYIFRIDSNDWAERSRIELQLERMKQEPELGMLGSNVFFHQQDGQLLWSSSFPLESSEILSAFQFTHPFVHPAVCFRKKIFEIVGGYRDQLEYCEDYDLFWRICEKSRGANLQEALTHVRFCSGSKSSLTAHLQDLESLVVRQLAIMRASQGSDDIKAARAKISELNADKYFNAKSYIRHADFALLAGLYRISLKSYLRGILAAPFYYQAYFKLIRMMLFICLPSLRWVLFYLPTCRTKRK